MSFSQIYGIFLIFVCLSQGQGTAGILNCNFEDTVDLTSEPQFQNGSYIYADRIIIPPEQVDIYNYEELANGQRVPRTPHPRGCLCKYRNCIKFCCQPTSEVFWGSDGKCHSVDEELEYPQINVILADGSKSRRNAIEDFTVIQGIPQCENAYRLKGGDDEWSIFESGMLLHHLDNVIITKRDYCLMPQDLPDNEWELIPMICPTVNIESATSTNPYSLAGLISTPFIIFTVLFHLIRPKLRNLRGKCIICCLASLAVGNTILATATMTDFVFPPIMCQSMGFIAYLFYECTFIWLTIIGYDLWRNAKSFLAILNERNRFLKYSEYGWGIPLMLTAIVITIRNSDMDHNYKPSIDNRYCWLKDSEWSSMIYYFGLNAVILCINFVFCSLTFCKELRHMKKCEELWRYERAIRKSFCVYSFLLVVLGVSFCFKMSAYMENILQLNTSNILLNISESVCIAEGPLIFFVLVSMTLMKRRKCSGSDEFESQLTEYSPGGNGSAIQPLEKGDIIQPLLAPPIVITSQIR